MTKHPFTLLIPALVAVGSVAVDAQRPVDAYKFDEIKMPALPVVPDDADERAIVAYVRNTPAINLDDALPQLELDAWLTATLLPYNTNAARAEWRLNWCEDLTSDLPSFRAELCAEMNVSLSEEKTVMLILAVGDWRPVSDGGSAWAMHPPAIREFFIKTPDNSLDIGPLSRLTTALDYPVDRWPTVDLEVAVNASPLRALPFDVVTFTIQVRNTGKRDVPRAEIQIAVAPDEGKEQKYQWFPAVPAGRTIAVEHAVRLPDGRGFFYVSANALSMRKRVKERDTSDNSASLWVHQGTDPLELPVTVPR